MRKLLWLILFIQVVVIGCDKRPDMILSEREMTALLVDIHRSEAYLTAGSAIFLSDSAKKVLRQSILKKHGVTQAEFDSSLNWYGRNIDEYVKLYANVEKQLDIKLKSAYKRAETSGEIASNDLDDSQNLWHGTPISRISKNEDLHLISFQLRPNEDNITSGDRFNWQFRKANDRTEVSMFMAVDYENGTTSYITRSFAQNTPNCKMTLQTDSTMDIKRIYGYARFYPDKGEVIFIDSIRIEKLPLTSSNYSQIFNQRSFNPNYKKKEAEEVLNDSIGGRGIESNEIKQKSQNNMPRPESLDPAASLRMKIQ
ncbi:MAG: DUF4296 domain-containing protein [Bacteroidales bacterium]|nr:DUF4296 domain-containing protein [Bacteroidales bacterium]